METRVTASPPAGCVIPCADPEQVATSRANLLDETTYGELADIFRALGDPTRAEIVYSLLEQDLCTYDLAELTGIFQICGLPAHSYTEWARWCAAHGPASRSP